jgi:hypothetical protein
VTVGTPALTPETPPATATQDAPDALIKPIATSPNTTNYLTLPDGGNERTRFGNASLDLGAAVAADSARLRESFVSETAVERFRSAPNTSAKTAVLGQISRDLENRTLALRQSQRRTIQRFDDGRVSAEVVLRQLSTADARARSIERGAVRLQGIARFTPRYTTPFNITSQLNNVKQRAGLFYTDPRQGVRASLVGQRNTKRYLLKTGGSGIVLAGTDSRREQYVRDAFIDNRFEQRGGDRFDGDIGTALDFVQELYPWAGSDGNQRGPDSDIDSMLQSVYKVSITHKHGELLTYLDGSDAEVFMEVQQKRLPRLPVTESVSETNTTADLTLRANLTHVTGPMAVTVRDTTTDTPVDARITVDGEFVGTTGDDGEIWTIQPGERVQVEATADGDRVAFTVVHDTSGV